VYDDDRRPPPRYRDGYRDDRDRYYRDREPYRERDPYREPYREPYRKPEMYKDPYYDEKRDNDTRREREKMDKLLRDRDQDVRDARSLADQRQNEILVL